MNPREITELSFDTEIESSEIVIVDFWASWCGPCLRFAPIFEKSAAERPDIAHLKVNVDENPGLSARFEISSIPTTMFIRDGVTVGRIGGAMDINRLRDLINQTEKLDMETVRAKLKKT